MAKGPQRSSSGGPPPEPLGQSRGARSREQSSLALDAAIARAVEHREIADLVDLLGRGSGLPGPRPNLELARSVGLALAARGSRGDAVVQALHSAEDEYLLIVAAMCLAARWRSGFDRRGALQGMHDLAEDPRHGVRAGLCAAVREVIAAGGEAAIAELAAWTDGYLHAHVVLEALSDRTLLAALPSGTEVLARLDEAFALADRSPRAAERSQGVRTLRKALPAQIAVIAARFPEALAWLAERTAAKRPETREVVAEAIQALRKASFKGADAERLVQALAATRKPPRDPSRIVQGTRRRGKGRGRA